MAGKQVDLAAMHFDPVSMDSFLRLAADKRYAKAKKALAAMAKGTEEFGAYMKA